MFYELEALKGPVVDMAFNSEAKALDYYNRYLERYRRVLTTIIAETILVGYNPKSVTTFFEDAVLYLHWLHKAAVYYPALWALQELAEPYGTIVLDDEGIPIYFDSIFSK